jgi:DNA modification methylase
MLGDSCERLAELPDNSVDGVVSSEPFGESLYVYSATRRDLANSRNLEEFMIHFEYIARQLFRVVKPGRVLALHTMDIPAMLVKDGWIGMKDFSGDVIRMFQKVGFILDGRIPIDKNQQAQSIRTHAKGLTFQQLERDRVWSRPALPDYILKFRKPGVNMVPVVGGISRDEWIDWAAPTWANEADRTQEAGGFPTWYGIRETDTLQYESARDDKDGKHVCPLQKEAVRRAVLLWTNPGELVLDMFSGIGTTAYVAVQNGRRAIGIELKPRYWKTSVGHLTELVKSMKVTDLFSYHASQLSTAAD